MQAHQEEEEPPLCFEDLPELCLSIILRKLQDLRDRVSLSQVSARVFRLTSGYNCERGILGAELFVQIGQSFATRVERKPDCLYLQLGKPSEGVDGGEWPLRTHVNAFSVFLGLFLTRRALCFEIIHLQASSMLNSSAHSVADFKESVDQTFRLAFPVALKALRLVGWKGSLHLDWLFQRLNGTPHPPDASCFLQSTLYEELQALGATLPSLSLSTQWPGSDLPKGLYAHLFAQIPSISALDIGRDHVNDLCDIAVDRLTRLQSLNFSVSDTAKPSCDRGRNLHCLAETLTKLTIDLATIYSEDAFYSRPYLSSLTALRDITIEGLPSAMIFELKGLQSVATLQSLALRELQFCPSILPDLTFPELRTFSFEDMSAIVYGSNVSPDYSLHLHEKLVKNSPNLAVFEYRFFELREVESILRPTVIDLGFLFQAPSITHVFYQVSLSISKYARNRISSSTSSVPRSNVVPLSFKSSSSSPALAKLRSATVEVEVTPIILELDPPAAVRTRFECGFEGVGVLAPLKHELELVPLGAYIGEEGLEAFTSALRETSKTDVIAGIYRHKFSAV